MKSFLFVVWSVVLGVSLVHAAPVDAKRAKEVALAFAKQNIILASHVKGVSEASVWQNVWVVALEPSGYVVVEMDDVRPPVIAFGKEPFPVEPAPAMASLLERPAVAEGGLTTLAAEKPAHGEWTELLAPGGGLTTLTASPEPPTEEEVYQWEVAEFDYAWDQNLPYNLYAPGISRKRVSRAWPRDELFSLAFDNYGMRSSCGCIPTAFSQVAAWFQWPYALRGVTHSTTISSFNEYATSQVATPGKPYDWGVLSEAIFPAATDEVNGGEVGRFMQHWAALIKVDYDNSGSAGGFGTNARPELLLLAGYKVVTPEGVGDEIVYDTRTNKWVMRPKKVQTDEARTALYNAFADAIYKYRVPVATGIAGHYIVCEGWAEEADTALSAETRYAKLNYGWGPNSGENGWFALRENGSDEDGEEVADDNKVFLQECFTILPLQCGEIVELSAEGVVPSKLKWYEAPYWSTNYINAERYLQAVTFDTTKTTSIDLNLEAAAMSDANWIYTPGRLEMDQSRAAIVTAVLFPELLRTPEELTFTVSLDRLTYKKKNSDGTLSGESEYVPDDQARELLLALEDITTGEIVETVNLALKEGQNTGTATISVTLDKEKVYRVLLMTGDTILDDEALDIPVDTLAYAVTGVKVSGCYPSTKTSYAFEPRSVRIEEYAPGALTFGTLAESTLDELNVPGKELWLAVTIETDTAKRTHDAIWKPLVVTKEEDVVDLPTIDFGTERLFLNNLTKPISFTTTGDIQSVKAYISQGFWLKEEYREGFELDANEIKEGEFTLAGRANDDPNALDTMRLDCYESVGRDAVLSLRAEDPAGNVVWTHTRLTWGLSDKIAEIAANRVLATCYLDKLLFASIYTACYTSGFLLTYGGEDNKATVTDAMKKLEDAVALGFAEKQPNATDATLNKIAEAMVQDANAFSPSIEVLSVKPNQVTFRLRLNASDDSAENYAQILAQQVNASWVKVHAGETLDAIEPLSEGFSVSCDDPTTGIYTLTLADDKNFFQFEL